MCVYGNGAGGGGGSPQGRLPHPRAKPMENSGASIITDQELGTSSAHVHNGLRNPKHTEDQRHCDFFHFFTFTEHLLCAGQ